MATKASGRIGAAESASVSAEGALLWVLHSQLRARWGSARVQSLSQAPPLELCAFAGDVSLLPAIVYPLGGQQLQRQQRVEGETPQRGPEDNDAVEVRAIRVPQKLFVHFVAATASVRLALVVSEYVKAAISDDINHGLSITGSVANDRVLRVGKWLCNQELLRWRLERNVFPEFSSELPALHAMGAELSKLSETTLTHVCEFLRAVEFARVTQTNKVLFVLSLLSATVAGFYSGAIHINLVLNLRSPLPCFSSDFPGSIGSSSVSEKVEYIDQYQEKLQRDRARQAMIRLAMLWENSTVRDGRPLVPGGRGGLDPSLPPVQPSLWSPPPPFLPGLPGEMLDPEGRRRRRRDLDLDFDVELRPAFDQRRREFIDRWW